MSVHAARGGAHEDLSWSALGRRARPRDVTVGDRGGGVGMRRSAQQGAAQGPAGAVRVDEASSASTFRELDDAFLQKQTKIWLGEVLHLRFDEDVLVADLLADGELLFQVSKVLWKRLLKKNREQLKQSKVYIYERLSFGRSNGKYMPYSKVDSFLKICQILGLAGIDLFTPSDVVEKRNVRKVCICIRSVSKKSHTMRLNIIFGGQNEELGDTHYDSDEAESRLSVLEPEDSVDEVNFAAVLSQLSDAPKEESEGYGEAGHDMHEEKSLAESVGSLNIGVVDSESVDSTPQNHDKESYSTHCATDQCSRTRTAKCSLSSEESDSISSHLVFESGKNDLESNALPVADTERIYDGHVKSLDHSIQGNEETVADHPKKESGDLRKDTGTINPHCDALTCDRESVCSSREESRYGLNGEPSDLSSESYSGLTPTHTTGGKLPMVSEDPVNNIEPSSQSVDKPVESEDIDKDSITPQRPEDDAPKSGNGVLKSVAGGITLVGAVFFMVHLRRSKERSLARVVPSLSEKSAQSDSRANNTDKEKVPDVYPGARLKV
ncbi:hypothetical protein BAE44_0014244 [Dichanthelium oligosanthes]|uniref:Calponin-homology (CH) domain-containing protein n=1 Tax=Dichanthelium oligosanthes TaxID=888268 RepID=A0A1E5VI03_9POAL|nr:hypothetical protein BAE44_0014244 [Dichanthelium oligosanthes]